MRQRRSNQGQWSSRLAFVLAATGSAIGLGSIWRFPFAVGEHGGGAFVALYLVAVFAIGFPLMIAEVMLGRRGRRNPISTMGLLSEEEAGHVGWRALGALGVATGLLILSYYSVISEWRAEEPSGRDGLHPAPVSRDPETCPGRANSGASGVNHNPLQFVGVARTGMVRGMVCEIARSL